MPKGMNPNSLKALEENRHKGQFKAGEKQVEIARKGGKTFGANSHKRRTMREELEILLSGTIEQKDKNGEVVATMTRSEALNVALMQKAMKGDTRAYEIVRDTIGEKPVDIVAVAEIDPNVILEIEDIVNE